MNFRKSNLGNMFEVSHCVQELVRRMFLDEDKQKLPSKIGNVCIDKILRWTRF